MSKKHESAQDIANRTVPAIGKKTSFQQAFPTIDSIKIETKEGDGRSAPPNDWTKVSDKRVFSEVSNYIDCQNSLCRKGGFKILEVVSDKVSKNDPSRSDRLDCIGTETMGKKSSRSCAHRLFYNIEIVFKANTTSTTA